MRIEIDHEMFWVGFSSLCDWLKNSRHLINQSDSRQLKTNRIFVKCVFGRSALVTCICVDECSLVYFLAYKTLLIQKNRINFTFICNKISCMETMLYNYAALFIFVAVSRLPLGVSDKRIRDSALSASSFWDRYHAASRGRLHICKSGRFRGAWSARRNIRGQWLQVSD